MESWKIELYHYGIPGMKWGVRRYQYADGTLTALGKKRYGSDASSETIRKDVRDEGSRQYNAISKLTKNASTITSSSSKMVRGEPKARKKYTVSREEIKKMSDQELRSAINRIIMENQYRDLTSVKVKPSVKERIADILDVSGNAVAVAGGIAGIATLLTHLA